jgi:cell division control protein 24
LQKRLRRVPGFSERYLNSAADTNNNLESNEAQSPVSPTAAAGSLATLENDPVNVVCGCLRLGASLAYIFNLLGEGKPLEVDPDATPTNLKACKKSAAHFIMACNTRLGWPYEEMFTATELLSQSTNGTVKVGSKRAHMYRNLC